MLYIDQPNTGSHSVVSPEMALMEGKIRTNGVDDLRQFERAFPMSPQVVMAVSKDVMTRYGVTEAVTPEKARTLLSPKQKTDVFFKELLPKVYDTNAASGWTGDLYFNIEGAGDYTVSVKPAGVTVEDGKQGAPTSETTVSMHSFASIMRWEILDDADMVDNIRIVSDEAVSDELSDDQLEMVAGGKGACGAEAGAGQACGGDVCSVAAGAGSACGGAVCGGAVGVGTVCGGDACSQAVGVGTGCAAAACAAAACSAAACGADACGADACAGAACAVAAGAGGACAGQACGADFAPGPDLGPCGLNVIPIVPFI